MKPLTIYIAGITLLIITSLSACSTSHQYPKQIPEVEGDPLVIQKDANHKPAGINVSLCTPEGCRMDTLYNSAN